MKKKAFFICSCIAFLSVGCSSIEKKGEISEVTTQKHAQSVKHSQKRERSKQKAISAREESSEISTECFIDSSDQEVSYRADAQKLVSHGPDFKRYEKKDALAILGEPVEIMTDYEALSIRLGKDGDEFTRVNEEIAANKLTENQGEAFKAQAIDVKGAGAFGGDLVGLIYDDPQKPNVYLLKGQVSYVTPMTAYMEFKGKLSQ